MSYAELHPLHHWYIWSLAVLPPCLYTATPEDCQLFGSHESLLLHPTLGWLSTLAVSSNSCGIKLSLFLLQVCKGTHTISGYHLLWGTNLGFICFPSVSLSCSSTWRSVAWVGHEDKFITAEKCSPLPPPSLVQVGLFNLRWLLMLSRNPKFSFLVMLP